MPVQARLEMKSFYQSAGEIVLLPKDAIQSNPLRERTAYAQAELEELSDSIRTNGLLEPLNVRIETEDTFRIVSGERRFRAAVMAGMTEIPCIIVGGETGQIISLYPLIVHLQQRRLHYLDEAACIRDLLEGETFTVTSLSQALSRPAVYLADKLKLLTLSDQIQTTLRRKELPEEYALLLLKAEETRREALLERILDEDMSLKEAEKALRRLDRRQGGSKVMIFKDLTVFINTVERAVETMRGAGVHAEMERTDTEDYIVYNVRISKTG